MKFHQFSTCEASLIITVPQEIKTKQVAIPGPYKSTGLALLLWGMQLLLSVLQWNTNLTEALTQCHV